MLLRMKMPTVAIVLFISTEMYLVLGDYSRADLIKKYPNLGTDFVMFSDGKNGTTIGYLSAGPATINTLAVDSKIANQITFTLYTRQNLKGSVLRGNTDVGNNFDKSKSTIFITHGWMSSGESDFADSVKDAYLKASDVNVFVTDWSSIAGNIYYLTPMKRTKDVGAYLAGLLNYLVNNLGMNANNFHLVGHSLGAHVSGFAARLITKGKVGRITGLDPALPGFNSNDDDRLNANDASFVDVIHTCAGFLGLKLTIGHVDFYPNGGGPPQPGCNVLELTESCSHRRSWQLFVNTITLKFQASQCDSSGSHDKNHCKGATVLMGESTPQQARGVYYLETTGKDPYLKS